MRGAHRIETAPSGRARCRRCGKPIAKGERRFGTDGEWWHLACAAETKNYFFEPFRARAEKLLAKGAAPARPPGLTHGPAPRNAELEARLAATPDDVTRGVFADYLLGHGDVWGELLALERTGQQAQFEKLFKKHQAALCGGLSPKLFTWKRGFIETATLDGSRRSVALQQIDDVCGLRAAVLLHTLSIPFAVTAELLARLSQRAPPGLTALSCVLGDYPQETRADCFRTLALPRLETLTVHLRWQPGYKQLAGLFDNRNLPALRTLEMRASSSPGLALLPDAVEALIASPLIRQLKKLHLHHGATDDAAIARFQRAKLSHLELVLKVWE